MEDSRILAGCTLASQVSQAAESVSTLISFFELLVGRMPTGRVEHTGGLATMFGNTPYAFLNTSVIDHAAPDEAAFRAALETGLERKPCCPFPSSIAFCEEWAPDDWERVAAEYGLIPYIAMTWMTADELLPPRRPAAALDLLPVNDVPTATDLALINDAGYGLGPHDSESIRNLNFWKPDTVAYVGCLRGTAVTCAAAFPIEGSVYIAFVATRPQFSGRGYAETVMRHTIDEGRRLTGDVRVTLHASTEGQRLYTAMGFASGPRIRMLTPP